MHSFIRNHLFTSLLVFRLLNVCIVQTFTHPDETWQSLEVAHHAVFGYGFITWEWRHALRGSAYPMLFALVYKLLLLLRLDDTFLLLAAPYALVACIAASADYATFHFARRLAGARVADWALLCSAVSFPMGTDIVRPLVNSAETALTAAAFAFWPWSSRAPAISQEKHKAPLYGVRAPASLTIALAFAALACILRPTSGIVWLCACASLVFRQPRRLWVSRGVYVGQIAIAIGSVALPAMLAIDRLGYKRWVFPPYQFYLFNVHNDLATWFGDSHMLYHFFASVPVLFTSMLPFVLHGIYTSHKRLVAMEPAMVAAAVLILFSMVGHMEYRFVYPLLPIGFAYSAVSMHALAGNLPAFTATPAVPVEELQHGNANSDPHNPAKKYKKSKKATVSVRAIVLYLLVTNVPAILYVNLVHQRGVIDVLKHLRQGAQAGNVTGIGFLMPCHSTPFYSHLHRDIPMWFLSCEPPTERSALDTHYWEANDFEQTPIEFIRAIFSAPKSGSGSGSGGGGGGEGEGSSSFSRERTRRAQPSHLVLYDCMAKRTQRELESIGYHETARFFNTYFSLDSRRKGDIVVFSKTRA
ncbi:Alg9-like mannosyltransferase family-domain-containing protein [Coemansia spiralis]|nr:Alg9-like mannosyltransferase family-domain-containing protein [Coemansia spiralis]